MSKERNNVTLKIFALTIAIVLWGYVMSEVNPDEERVIRNVSVTFTNKHTLDRQKLVVMEPEEVTVSVEVTGKRSDMIDFDTSSIKASLDLSGYTEGQRKVPTKVELDQSSKIKIKSWEPKEVLFTFDKLITKDKQVTIKTIGKLDPGYILGNLETKSQTVLLKGPRSWVNEVSEIVTTVNLENRKEDGKVSAPIKLLDDQGNDVRGVEMEPSFIDIQVPILRTIKVPIELQIANQLPENYEITEVSINPSNIDIKGSSDILKLITIQTKAVDINSLIEDTEMEVELNLPKGVELLNPNEKVTVTLKVQESLVKTFSYKLDEITIKNLADDLSIDEEDYIKDIDILLKGNREIIEDLNKEDLQVSIDLATLIEGRNEVYIKYELPTGVTVKEILPQPIEINLIKD